VAGGWWSREPFNSPLFRWFLIANHFITSHTMQ
jgi:hypothetical protein